MTALSLTLLGTFQVESASERIFNFESDKARALLAYLVVEQVRPHERAKLAALFWPEQNDRTALRNLTQTLSRVRRAIHDRDASPSFFLTTYQVIQFNPASQHQLDVAEFMRLMATNLPAHMENAVALYQGEFLAGFHLPDSPEFESWLLFRREHFQRVAMDALQRLTDVSLSEGVWSKAIDFAGRQLEIDNLHEPAYRQLMTALARSGQRAAALAQYQKCKASLADELDALPEQETEELYAQIRDHTLPPDTYTEPPRSVPLSPQNPATPSLPQLTTPLLGRSVEMRWLMTQYTERAARLVTVVGPGGSGKTHLALHTGHALQTQFRDGVFFVPLVTVTTHEQMIGAIADGLQLTFQSSQLTQAQLLDYLRGRHLLLILDNFEHLIEAATLIDAMLQHAPRVAVMTTSRERLNLNGEQLFALNGLQVPDDDALPDEIGNYGAIQLFVQSARRISQDFVLDDLNIRHGAKIVRLLRGLPLAIELAAAWVRVLDCQTIAEEIEASLDFLTAPYRNFPERHRSLRAVFDYSWQLATAAEQQAMRRLAVFPGSFSPLAARQIADVDIGTIRALLDKSLLQNERAGRVMWHPLLHQYARERHDTEVEEADQVWHRYVLYYIDMLSRRAAAIVGSAQKKTLQEIDEELDNIIAIRPLLGEDLGIRLETRAGDGSAPDLTALARHVDMATALYTLFQFYRIRGRLEELIETFEIITRTMESTDDAESKTIYWYLRIFQVCAFLHVARYDEAEALFDRIFAYLELHDHTYLRALCLKYRAMLDVHRGRFSVSLQNYERALAVFRTLGDENAQADILNSLGVCSNDLGEFADAIGFLEKSIALNRRAGNSAGLVYALSNRGASAYNLGDFAEAQQYHAEALTVAREVDFRPGIMLCLLNLADAAIGLGEYAQACALAEEGLLLTMKNQDPRQAVWARSSLGRAALGMGALDEAHEHFCRGIAVGTAIRVVPRTLEALVGLAQWLVAMRDVEGATELLGFCIAHPNLQRKIMDRARGILTCIEPQLDAAALTGALARGRTQSLEAVAEAHLHAYNRGRHTPILVATDSGW